VPALALLQGVWERLAFAFRQEHYAEDGEDSEGGEDHMVEKVAAVILELHQGGGGHANTTSCQHQAEATASGREMKEREEEKENTNQPGRPRGGIIRQYFGCCVDMFLYRYSCQLSYSVCGTHAKAFVLLQLFLANDTQTGVIVHLNGTISEVD